MRILQLTPGAGAMFCGNCVRDNALVAALRGLGHEALMVPLYLPLTLDEPDQSAGIPIRFGGINVFLEQKSTWFRTAPQWLRNLLDWRPLLNWAGRQAGRTQAEGLGDLTLSMLRGELGNQARELDELVAWLATQPKPDVVFLSNTLLVGLARQLQRQLGRPLVCSLQGEHYFLDRLPEPHRAACWRELAERTQELDLLIAPSRYFAQQIRDRLQLPEGKIRVVFNGIALDGYRESPVTAPPAPVLGYFARLCPEKGLGNLVAAFIELRRRDRVPGLRLRVGGGLGPVDLPFVKEMRQRLRAEGLAGEADFHPNLDRRAKQEFLRSLSVFCVPALYGEAFGLYVLEALAAGVPVVLPRSGAFPELVEATGGGILCQAGNPQLLADAIESLLLAPDLARALGETGRRAVFERFSAEVMAHNVVEAVAALQSHVFA